MGESTKTVLDMSVFQRKRWCISASASKTWASVELMVLVPVWDWKPEFQECCCAQGHKKMEVSAQLESGLILLLLLCLLQALNRFVMPIHIGESGLLYLSTNSNGNLVQKYQIIRSYTINSYIIAPVIWTYLSLVKLTYKINHHKEQVEINETEKMIETINGTRDCFWKGK